MDGQKKIKTKNQGIDNANKKNWQDNFLSKLFFCQDKRAFTTK